MTERVKIIMVDTNVWVDLYVPGRPLREASLSFFEVAQRDDVELTFTVDIARAVYRIVSHEAKRWVRQDKGSLPDAYAKAIASHAWDFMESMQEQATAVGSATADLWLASKLRDQHAEIEDNLIVAACMRIKADYLVTNDESLLRHAPVAAVTPAKMVQLLDIMP